MPHSSSGQFSLQECTITVCPDNFTVFHLTNPVARFERGEAVSDNEDGLALIGECPDRLANLVLGLAIEFAGGFVKDEQ